MKRNLVLVTLLLALVGGSFLQHKATAAGTDIGTGTDTGPKSAIDKMTLIPISIKQGDSFDLTLDVRCLSTSNCGLYLDLHDASSGSQAFSFKKVGGGGSGGFQQILQKFRAGFSGVATASAHLFDPEGNVSAYREYVGYVQSETDLPEKLPLVLKATSQVPEKGMKSALNVYVTTGVLGSGDVPRWTLRGGESSRVPIPAKAGVKVVAVAAEGEKFVGWSEVQMPGGVTPCVDTQPTCVMYLQNVDYGIAYAGVTAKFAKIETTLTLKKAEQSTGEGSLVYVARDPQGNVLFKDEKDTYPAGTVIEITAKPDTGSEFASWTGCLASPANPLVCTLTLGTTPVTVEGKFKLAGTQLTVAPSSSSIVAGTVTYIITEPGKPAVTETRSLGVYTTVRPEGTTVTATYTPPTAGATTRVRLYDWGGAFNDCADDALTCTITLGATDLEAIVTTKNQYLVKIGRTDTRGSLALVAASPTQTGIDCNTDACKGDAFSTPRWYWQGTNLTITTSLPQGYAVSGWDGLCNGSGKVCAVKNLAAPLTTRVAFKDHVYSLTISKCGTRTNAIDRCPDHAVTTGSFNLQVAGNASNVYIGGSDCGNGCYKIATPNPPTSVVTPYINEAKHKTLFVVNPLPASIDCVAYGKIKAASCAIGPFVSGNNDFHETIRVKDQSGNDIWSDITSVDIYLRYSGVSSISSVLGDNLASLSTGVRASFTLPTVTLPSLPSLDATSVVVTASNALMPVKILGTRIIEVVANIVPSGQRLLAALLVTGTADLTPYDLLATPRGAGVGTPVTFTGSIGNIGSTAFAGRATSTLLVHQYVNGVWVTSFTAVTTSGNTPAQRYAFLTWNKKWTPTVAGQYRMRFCTKVPGGTDAATEKNCSFYTYFTVGQTYTPPQPTKQKLTVTQEGGGTLTSTSDTPDINFVGCSAACERSFLSGATVTLTAKPNVGKRFVKWDGLSGSECVVAAGSPNKCQLTADAYKAVTAVFESALTAEGITLCGDANRSGTVNSADAQVTLRYAVGNTTDINTKNADVTGDGKITSTDANWILKASVGTAKIENVNGVCRASAI